jgi:hypothetical protein
MVKQFHSAFQQRSPSVEQLSPTVPRSVEQLSSTASSLTNHSQHSKATETVDSVEMKCPRQESNHANQAAGWRLEA